MFKRMMSLDLKIIFRAQKSFPAACEQLVTLLFKCLKEGQIKLLILIGWFVYTIKQIDVVFF